MHGAAVGRIEECSRWRRCPGKRPVVAHVDPKTTGAALAFGQHRHGGVVGMDALGREHVRADDLDERHQRRGRSADPIGERRDVNLDTLPRIGRALTIERQMQTVFAE
jgi:hypothetical protein